MRYAHALARKSDLPKNDRHIKLYADYLRATVDHAVTLYELLSLKYGGHVDHSETILKQIL